MTVAAILKQKGGRVETVRPIATVHQVCDLLADRKIGAAVVQELLLVLLQLQHLH